MTSQRYRKRFNKFVTIGPLVLNSVTMGEGVSKIIQNWVTSFMDDPFRDKRCKATFCGKRVNKKILNNSRKQ